MEQKGRIYTVSGENSLIVRKKDDFIMGARIDLGSADSIDNYEEREFTPQEIEDFYRSLGDDFIEESETTI